MSYKKKLIWLCVIVVLLTLIQTVLPYRPAWTIIYADYIFVPFQSLRNILFGWFRISFGDILYFVLGISLIVVLVKWIYYLVKIRTHSKLLLNSFLNTIIVVSFIYLWFLLGWGGNYYKPSLATYWGMDHAEWHDDTSEIAYNRFLIKQINRYAPLYTAMDLKQVRKDAMLYYKRHTDCKARLHGLNIKPSLYGFLMQLMGVQGYYNPLSGEAQVNRFLPEFMLPFVVVHEMAHQAGIAAEDDANLMAYTISVKSGDPDFRYSAYLNMWLYNHNRIKRRDSVLANEMRSTLNPVTLQHLDTLKQIRQRYKSEVSVYSSSLYDMYLKLFSQKDGIMSYNRAVITAWTWEQAADSVKRKSILLIP